MNNLTAVATDVAQSEDFGWRHDTVFGNVIHQVHLGNTLGILLIIFLAPGRFDILWVCDVDVDTIAAQNPIDGYMGRAESPTPSLTI